jgi:hypothetical protein
MSGAGKSLGQAIDEVIAALEPLPEPLRATAIRAACEVLGLDDVGPNQARETVELSTTPTPQVTPSAGQPAKVRPPVKDIRSLKEEKKPKTALEMACLVAYYLESLAPVGDQKADISKDDLDKYFKQAQYKLPKRIEQVLIDAKAAGYFDSAARGRYKLNPVGHNLVVHSLPRSKS